MRCFGHPRDTLMLGHSAPDGTVTVTDVLCSNFPKMTREEVASLSWRIQQWCNSYGRKPVDSQKASPLELAINALQVIASHEVGQTAARHIAESALSEINAAPSDSH